jgi:SAM-dependent methyltransferase
MTMIRQRPVGAAPVVRACAEALPFSDASFESGLAVLTIHHWADWRAGLRELRRVVRNRIVLLTWDPQSDGFWLVRDYCSHLLEVDRRRFPSLSALREVLGDFEIASMPIPYDCSDGFMGAYWRRPAAYLDPDVRAAISGFASDTSLIALARLAQDLDSGAWQRKHGRVLDQETLDLGYRLVIA